MDQGSLRPASSTVVLMDVTVQFFKYPGDLHWRHDLTMLGKDEHGVWLGGPAGSIVQRGREPAKEWPVPFVQLIAPGRWWTLLYNGQEASNFRIYVDVVTQPCWVSESRVEMVDLDLDVVLDVDGRVKVLDEDEFEEHRVKFQYPESIVDRARATAADVALKLERRQEPFGNAGAAWLDQVL